MQNSQKKGIICTKCVKKFTKSAKIRKKVQRFPKKCKDSQKKVQKYAKNAKIIKKCKNLTKKVQRFPKSKNSQKSA